MKYLNYCILFAFLIMLSSCSKPITYKDNGKTISLTEQAPFKVILKGDDNSEFKWELNTKLQFVKLETPVSKTVDGTSDIYTFNFMTVSNGEDLIQLIYTDGNTVSKTFELKILVGTMGYIEAE